jgi:hypothetical protein
MADPAGALYPGGPKTTLGNEGAEVTNKSLGMNPDQLGKLLFGTKEEREKVVGFHGYETSINALNATINANKARLKTTTGKDADFLSNQIEDHTSYRDELLSRQGS